MWSLLAAKPNLETAIHCNSSLANTDFASVIRQKGMSQIWQMELLFSPLAPIPREDPPTLPLSPAIVVLSLPSLRKTTTPPTDPLLFLLRNKALPGLGSTDCSGRSFLKDLNFFEKPRPWSSRDRTSAPRCPEHTSTILEGLQQAPKVWPTIDPRPGTQWPHVITIDRGGAAGSLMGLRLRFVFKILQASLLPQSCIRLPGPIGRFLFMLPKGKLTSTKVATAMKTAGPIARRRLRPWWVSTACVS